MMTIRSFCRCVMTLSVALSPAVAFGQIFAAQQRLDGSASGYFAISLAIDGTTAVIGASNETVEGASKQGSVYVATRATGSWTLQQRLLASDGRANEYFGSAVAMSGNTIVVAADGGGTISNGAVYVFVWNGASWVQQAKLVASDGAGNTRFGFSVAIRGDIIAVGAPRTRWPDPVDSGAVYVYTRAGSTFTEQKLLATSYRDLGTSVALSGSTLCAGAIRDGGTPGSFRGAAFLYERTGSTWLQQQIVSTTDPGIGARFGTSCAIEGDTLVVGAPGDSSTTPPGAAYVFSRVGQTWTFQQRLGNLDLFGRTVVLSGSWLAVGAPRLSNPGNFFVFEQVGGTWTERQRTRPNIGFGSDSLGSALAFDGTTIAVGAPALGWAHFYARVTTGLPGAPSAFNATVTGNTVSMTWGAPASGGTPTGYTLVARTGAGQLITTVPVGTARNVSITAPNGAYRLSVLATNASGAGPESAVIAVSVPAGGAAVPGTPAGLAVTVAGNAATFIWTPPSGGGAPTGYQLLAGTSPSFVTPFATLPLPASPNTVTIGGVPTGTFWVRLRAVNAAGLGPESNEVTLTVGGATPPAAPTLNAATVSGRTVTLTWRAGGGSAPTSYVMTAAATSGGPRSSPHRSAARARPSRPCHPAPTSCGSRP